MEEIRDYNLLLHSLAERRGSFVNQDNVNDFEYERTYKNPIDKRPIHVFINSADGRTVHLEDDGTLYTSFGPVETESEVPRERGELTDSLKQIIQVRGGDESRLDVLDGQPAPSQEFLAPVEPTTPTETMNTDQMMVIESETEPAPTTQQTDAPPSPATPTP